MGKTTRSEKEKFITKYKLKEAFSNAEAVEENLWETLVQIKEDYISRCDKYKNACMGILDKVYNSNDMKEIHSTTYRVKDVDSLLVKIVRKKARLSTTPSTEYNIEKYRELNASNYYKIITDLAGLRILIRYRKQWIDVNNWIKNGFFKGEKKYITNYINDYPASTCADDYIAEKPIIYFRAGDNLYYDDKFDNQHFIKIKSDEGYNSIHYIIYTDGKYVEVQVRTIFDEAWSETTHDLVYKCKDKKIKLELEEISKCLAKQTMSAESLVNLMYEKSEESKPIKGKKTVNKKNDLPNKQNKQTGKIKDIENRSNKLNQQPIIDFDGSVSSLI